jgi:hypothetical protein
MTVSNTGTLLKPKVNQAQPFPRAMPTMPCVVVWITASDLLDPGCGSRQRADQDHATDQIPARVTLGRIKLVEKSFHRPDEQVRIIVSRECPKTMS